MMRGMDLLWDFIVDRYKVVSRLADERRGLKESGNMGWKDKGKGGQGQSGDAKKKLLYRMDINAAQAKDKSPPQPGPSYICYVPGCNNKVKHSRAKCDTWLAMDVPTRIDVALGKKWCMTCLVHHVGKPCRSKGPDGQPMKCTSCGSGEHHFTICFRSTASWMRKRSLTTTYRTIRRRMK